MCVDQCKEDFFLNPRFLAFLEQSHQIREPRVVMWVVLLARTDTHSHGSPFSGPLGESFIIDAHGLVCSVLLLSPPSL